MNISVTMPTWNNARRLKKTLEAFTRLITQDIQWELILVNNNCTDDTDQEVEPFLVKLPLVYLKESRQGTSPAKNKALQHVKGELIIFADDDITPCSEWLPSYWNAYRQNPKGFYFGGPIESEFENPRFDRDLIALASCSIKGFDLPQGSGPTDMGKHFMGANWACPAVKIKELGGFDEEFGLNPASGRVITGEESELIRELNESGWKGYYLAEAKIKHFVPDFKVTLMHIAGRWAAAGEKQAREIIRSEDFHNRPRVPFWVCRAWLGSWLKWVSKKVCFQKGYAEYKPLCKYSRLAKVLWAELRERRRGSSTLKTYA